VVQTEVLPLSSFLKTGDNVEKPKWLTELVARLLAPVVLGPLSGLAGLILGDLGVPPAIVDALVQVVRALSGSL
jgi:hypothetical protein